MKNLNVNDFYSKMVIEGKEMSCCRVEQYLSDIIVTKLVLRTYDRKTNRIVYQEELNLIISYSYNNKGECIRVIENLKNRKSCCIEYFKKGQGHCLYTTLGKSTRAFLNNQYQLALEDYTKKEQENQVIFAFLLGTLL